MVSKKTSKKPVKTKVKTEKVKEKVVEVKEEPKTKWQPVSKEEKKKNGNFFAKMVDFFDF